MSHFLKFLNQTMEKQRAVINIFKFFGKKRKGGGLNKETYFAHPRKKNCPSYNHDLATGLVRWKKITSNLPAQPSTLVKSPLVSWPVRKITFHLLPRPIGKIIFHMPGWARYGLQARPVQTSNIHI